MTWSHLLQIAAQSLGITAFLVLQLVALLMIPLDLPGLWVQFATAVIFSFATGLLGWFACGIILFLALSGEGLDWLLGRLGASRVGASKLAGWGALLCGLAGALFGGLVPIPLPIPFVLPLLMSFLGTFVGAMLGEIIHQRNLHPQWKIAFGAVLSRAGGIAVKLCVAFSAAGVGLMAILFNILAQFSK